jgi:hypothetical protein
MRTRGTGGKLRGKLEPGLEFKPADAAVLGDVQVRHEVLHLAIRDDSSEVAECCLQGGRVKVTGLVPVHHARVRQTVENVV